jgi:hypothetical protein
MSDTPETASTPAVATLNDPQGLLAPPSSCTPGVLTLTQLTWRPDLSTFAIEGTMQVYAPQIYYIRDGGPTGHPGVAVLILGAGLPVPVWAPSLPTDSPHQALSALWAQCSAQALAQVQKAFPGSGQPPTGPSGVS